VRKLLEGEAARLAAGRVPPEDVAQARARIEEVLALPEDAPLPDGPTSAEDLHRLIAQAAGNPVLEEMIAALRTRTAMFRFGRLPTRRRKVMQEHLQILDAIGKGDGDKAREAMEAHIAEVRSTILAKLSGH
jgi:DNA-binding GntR family transcriptional regulator